MCLWKMLRHVKPEVLAMQGYAGRILLCAVLLCGAAAAQGPTAEFTADVTTGKGALTAWFTDQSLPGDSPIAAWQWDFGDGPGTGLDKVQNPVHRYQNPGTYSVALTVTTSLETSTARKADYVSVAVAPIFLVDLANVSGTEDGLTWASAFSTIQAAVSAAAMYGEVWVAEGVYTATSNPVVTMKEGVHLYGGFTGTETQRTQREWQTHVTMIDGQQTYQGVYGANNSTLDGFTITRGHSDSGGGMYNNSTSPTVANCTFTGNAVGYCGGAM